MKIIFLLLLLATIIAEAQKYSPVKACDFTIKGYNGDVTPTSIRIIREDGRLVANMSQRNGKYTYSIGRGVDVAIADLDVREALRSDDDTNNEAESIIAHAMRFQNVKRDLGFDPATIRHAKLFKIGDSSSKPPDVIVEAADKDRKLLGSFIMSLSPLACERRL